MIVPKGSLLVQALAFSLPNPRLGFGTEKAEACTKRDPLGTIIWVFQKFQWVTFFGNKYIIGTVVYYQPSLGPRCIYIFSSSPKYSC